MGGVAICIYIEYIEMQELRARVFEVAIEVNELEIEVAIEVNVKI